MNIFRFILSLVAAYLFGSPGFVLGESVYVDGNVFDGTGALVTVSRMLPELAIVPFTRRFSTYH